MPQTPAEGLKPSLLLVSARSDTSSKNCSSLLPANWHQKIVPSHAQSGRSVCVKKTKIKFQFQIIPSAQGGVWNDPAATLWQVISGCYEAGGGNGLQEAYSLVCVC